MRNKKVVTTSFAGLVSVFGAMGIAQPCAAAAPDNSAAQSDAGTSPAIESVVVTAERRQENMQDVPISITAVSASQIQSAGVTDSTDLTRVVPSLNFGTVSGFAAPFLRGVGTTNITAGDEGSVATYVDGVYMGSVTTASLPYNNIQSIEVLKGPQGTLFGRNTTGGLINIITRQPGQEPDANAFVSYDNYETVEGGAYISGALSDHVAANLSVHVRHQGRGYGQNDFNGTRVGKEEFTSVRTSWHIKLASATTLDLNADYTWSSDTEDLMNANYPGSVPLTVLPGFDALGNPVAGGTDTARPWHMVANKNPALSVTTYGVSAKLKSDIGFADFVSISSYRHSQHHISLDDDLTTADGMAYLIHPTLGLVQLPTLSYTSTIKAPYFYTQEFQLLSVEQKPFKWIAGLFGQDSEEGYKPLGVGFTINQPAVSYDSMEKTEAAGLYAQGTYSFDNGISLTAGLRGSYERRALKGTASAGGFTFATTDKSTSFRNLSFRIAADYRFENVMLLYASYNRGFKSGLYVSNDINTEPAVKPERLDAYEIGVKSDPTSYLRLNADVYLYNSKNLQQFTVDPLTALTGLQNINSARMWGMEVEATILPFENLSLNIGLAYEHSEYTDFPNSQAWFFAPPAGYSLQTISANGNQMTRTPKFTGNIGAEYHIGLGGSGDVMVSANYYHNSGFPWDPSGFFVQKAYDLLDGQIEYIAPDGHWTFAVFGHNITNEAYARTVIPGARNVAEGYAPPATYGVRLGWKY